MSPLVFNIQRMFSGVYQCEGVTRLMTGGPSQSDGELPTGHWSEHPHPHLTLASHHPHLTSHHPLLTSHYPPLTSHHPLLTSYHFLLTSHHPLFILHIPPTYLTLPFIYLISFNTSQTSRHPWLATYSSSEYTPLSGSED